MRKDRARWRVWAWVGYRGVKVPCSHPGGGSKEPLLHAGSGAAGAVGWNSAVDQVIRPRFVDARIAFEEDRVLGAVEREQSSLDVSGQVDALLVRRRRVVGGRDDQRLREAAD